LGRYDPPLLRADRYSCTFAKEEFMSRDSGFIAFTLLVSLLPLGCISPAVHKNVPQFADAVTIATDNSKAAFQIVDQKYMDVESAKLVVNYDKTGFNPNNVRHLLHPEDLQVRLDLLNALQQYASTLSQVSADTKLQEFDDKTKAFGKSLQDLTATDAFKSFVKNSKTEVNIATTAIDALGRWFIERKRQKELPKLIEQMQEPVRRTAELLQADIGNRHCCKRISEIDRMITERVEAV
jgi:hypothetical protein